MNLPIDLWEEICYRCSVQVNRDLNVLLSSDRFWIRYGRTQGINADPRMIIIKKQLLYPYRLKIRNGSIIIRTPSYRSMIKYLYSLCDRKEKSCGTILFMRAFYDEWLNGRPSDITLFEEFIEGKLERLGRDMYRNINDITIWPIQ